MKMKRSFLFILGLASAHASALDVRDPARFVCRQGNCVNGQGSVWDAALSVTMHGNWANGQTIPGMAYTVVSPAAPAKKFKQVYGKDGFLESGDQPRSLGVMNGVVPAFSGSYGRINHAFMRQPVAVIKRGVYDTGLGYEYRGRFEYLAAKSGMATGWGSGFYIFYGDKIDTEEDEKESGLFISDETMGGGAVRFYKADPSYLAVMQKRYQQDMQIAKGEFAQQEAEKGWRTALSIIGKVAFTVASGGSSFSGNNNSLGADIAMTLVSSMFNNDGNANVQDIAMQAVDSATSGDKQLGRALGKAVSEGANEAGKK